MKRKLKKILPPKTLKKPKNNEQLFRSFLNKLYKKKSLKNSPERKNLKTLINQKNLN